MSYLVISDGLGYAWVTSVFGPNLIYIGHEVTDPESVGLDVLRTGTYEAVDAPELAQRALPVEWIEFGWSRPDDVLIPAGSTSKTLEPTRWKS